MNIGGKAGMGDIKEESEANKNAVKKNLKGWI